jgi:hypothetical protein
MDILGTFSLMIYRLCVQAYFRHRSCETLSWVLSKKGLTFLLVYSSALNTQRVLVHSDNLLILQDILQARTTTVHNHIHPVSIYRQLSPPYPHTIRYLGSSVADP